MPIKMTWQKVIKFWFGLFFLFGLFLAVSLYWRQKRHFSFEFSPRPILKNHQSVFPQDLTAEAYLVMDANTGMVVKSKNIHQRLAPASLTKIPAAIVALNKYPLNQTVTVKEAYSVGRNMGLKENQQISIIGLLHGLLIHSANDAAYVLAGETELKRAEFIDQMNYLSDKYDLEETYFVNSDGIQGLGHLSSVFDLAHLTRLGLKNPIFRELVQTKEKTVYDITGEIEYRLENTNQLLAESNLVKGVKTGWTPQAGECLISLVEIEDNQVIIAVMESEDRFGETRKLITWAQESLSWLDLEN